MGSSNPPKKWHRPAAMLLVGGMVLMFAGLGSAWNLIGGFANQISLGHAAFFGVGAYTSTLLLKFVGLSPWLGMLAAGGVAGLVSLVIAVPTFRLGRETAVGARSYPELLRWVSRHLPPGAPPQ